MMGVELGGYYYSPSRRAYAHIVGVVKTLQFGIVTVVESTLRDDIHTLPMAPNDWTPASEESWLSQFEVA